MGPNWALTASSYGTMGWVDTSITGSVVETCRAGAVAFVTSGGIFVERTSLTSALLAYLVVCRLLAADTVSSGRTGITRCVACVADSSL